MKNIIQEMQDRINIQQGNHEKELKNTLHNDKVSGRQEGLMNMAAENWRKILRSVEKERNATCTRQKEKKYIPYYSGFAFKIMGMYSVCY